VGARACACASACVCAHALCCRVLPLSLAPFIYVSFKLEAPANLLSCLTACSQVLSLCAAPFLLERPDVTSIFAPDAVARARKLIAAFKVGSCFVRWPVSCIVPMSCRTAQASGPRPLSPLGRVMAGGGRICATRLCGQVCDCWPHLRRSIPVCCVVKIPLSSVCLCDLIAGTSPSCLSFCSVPPAYPVSHRGLLLR